MKYRILEDNMDRLTKKMTRIQNKCRKYGCDFTFEEVGEEFKEVEDEYGNKKVLRFVIVEAEGLAIINDWQFIAKMEHCKTGNIINKAVDVEVPERYYNSECQCEHCKTKRSRRFTYIVRNTKTNEFKQVGKSCLQDFTNGMSANFAAECMDGVEELIKGETPVEGMSYRTYTSVKTMLLFFQETINHFGYVRNTYENGANSTANRASRYYRAYYNIGGYWSKEVNEEARKEMKKIGFDHTKESVNEDVEAALRWIAEQEESTNYIHNLKVACTNNYIPETGYALVASLIPTYNKNLEFEAIRKEKEEKAKKEKEVSDFVGNVGERLTFTIATFRCLTSWETQFGLTFLYKITDESGNVFVWKTNKDVDDEYVINKTITGTVKEHSEFRDTKQTVITRCKIK